MLNVNPQLTMKEDPTKRDQALRKTLAAIEAGGSVSSLPSDTQPGETAYELVVDEAALENWIAQARKLGFVAVDTETTSLDAMQAELVGLSLSVQAGRACYVPVAHKAPNGQGALDLGDPAQPAMGVVHAMRPDAGDAVAEFSVGVVDAYHGLGIGRLLTATLLLDAAGGRLEAFRAHVLSENDAARSFIKRLGGVHVGQDGPQAEYLLEVAPALARLREESRPGGLAAIFAHFDAREAAAAADQAGRGSLSSRP